VSGLPDGDGCARLRDLDFEVGLGLLGAAVEDGDEHYAFLAAELGEFWGGDCEGC
jgi:hypothetical protein